MKIMEEESYPGLPKWLNNKVIKDVLINRYDNIKIISVNKTINDDNKGDHYLSEIIHFSIKILSNEKEDILNLIIKDMSKGICEFIIEVNGVENEISMYKEILTILNKLLPSSITPEMYYYNHTNNYIILNDISDNFRIYNRIDMLDYEHCKIALKTLGEFHASSLIIYEKSPEKFNIVGKETMYNNNLDSFPYYFIKHNLKSLIKIMNNNNQFKKFIDKIKIIEKTCWEDINEAVNINEFTVLNHGDFWTTNILYSYLNNNPINCKFVDFQMTRLCPPTMDLFQFITISMRSDVRNNYLDQLLTEYVNSLNNTFKLLNSKNNLTLLELYELMKKTKIFGILNGLTLTEIALCDPSDPLELSDITKDSLRNGFPKGNPYEKGYKQERVQNHILSLLNWFETMHYI